MFHKSVLENLDDLKSPPPKKKIYFVFIEILIFKQTEDLTRNFPSPLNNHVTVSIWRHKATKAFSPSPFTRVFYQHLEKNCSLFTLFNSTEKIPKYIFTFPELTLTPPWMPISILNLSRIPKKRVKGFFCVE